MDLNKGYSQGLSSCSFIPFLIFCSIAPSFSLHLREWNSALSQHWRRHPSRADQTWFETVYSWAQKSYQMSLGVLTRSYTAFVLFPACVLYYFWWLSRTFPSLALLGWDPCRVQLGFVGYCSSPCTFCLSSSSTMRLKPFYGLWTLCSQEYPGYHHVQRCHYQWSAHFLMESSSLLPLYKTVYILTLHSLILTSRRG